MEDEKSALEEFAKTVGGIVRDGAIYQGAAAAHLLSQESWVEERDKLRSEIESLERALSQERRLTVVMWRQLLALNPQQEVCVTADVYDLNQETKDYPLGTCEWCGGTAPLAKRPDPHGGEGEVDVCTWGCG